MAAGCPVISVVTPKKELIGNFKNEGRTWRCQTELVNSHDFPSAAKGKVSPIGHYDIKHNLGYVYVGISADTAEFAVDAIFNWWQYENRPRFDNEQKLLILADAGGSNGYRPRLFQSQLQECLADQFDIEVIVCHYPTGASSLHPIEHRLFSYISLNWAGEPLRSFETILGYIQNTTTKTGLKVEAFIIEQEYQRGIKVSNREMATLNLVRRKICPKWNYVIKPRVRSE